MRYLLSVSVISLVASGAFAEDFTLGSAVSAVTIYPQGATVTRSMVFDIPAGQHRLLVSDIPYEFQSRSLQIRGGDGLVFGASRIISTRVQPEAFPQERREALESRIKSLEAQVLAQQEQSAAAGLVINAANARIKLLESLGSQQAQGAAQALEGGAVSVEGITALVSLVGSETLSALQDAQQARVEVASINRAMEELRQKLAEAREELQRLVEPAEWRYGIALDVEAGAATAGVLQISYVVNEASWRPVYDFALDTGSDTLTVARKVMVGQYTGEDWRDAALTVSTSAPFDGRRFSLPYTQIARIAPPVPVLADNVGLMSSRMVAAAPMVLAEPEAEMAGASLNFQGITATYTLPEGTVIATNDEGTLVTLNKAAFDVDLSARANMQAGYDTAFLIAALTNSTDEPFLPGEASFFRDGAFVQAANIGMIAAGAEAELGFGKVDGLMVKRTVLNREDGSSGVLTTSNDRTEDYELSVENVTNRAWDVVVYDSVPVSEQEELEINWSARPQPSETDVDGRRGVLAWAFALESGESKTIKLSYALQWPEGEELVLGR